MIPVDPTKEFLTHPDANRLIRALIEVGEQTETFFKGPQEIEGVVTLDTPAAGEHTLTLHQTRFLAPPGAPSPTPTADSAAGQASLAVTPTEGALPSSAADLRQAMHSGDLATPSL